MYLRPSNKWKEFLLAENSQPAVLLTEITLASAVSNLFSKKTQKMIRRELDAGTWIREPPVPGTQSIKPGEFSSFPEDKKDRVVQLYTNHFKDQLLGNQDRQITGIIPQDLEDNQKGLALTWIVRLARQDDRTAGFLLTGYPGRGVGIEFPAVREDLETFFHYQQFMEPPDLNRIKDFDELEGVVLNARDAIKRHQQSKTYKDFEQGVTLLRGSFLRNEEGQILKRFKIVTGPDEEPVASAVGATREDAVRSFKQENPKLGAESLSAVEGRILYDYDNGFHIPPKESRLLSTGLKVEVPYGYMLEIKNKSGIALKRQLLVGACVVDPGYNGELYVNLHNVGHETQVFKPGDKVAQAVLIPISHCKIEEVATDEFLNFHSNRGEGAFGSTGER